MANIKVSLELENQAYITGIKNAETATENLGKTAAKAGKQGADGIGQMTNSMDMLSTVTTKANQLIAAVVATFAAVGASSLKMADDIVDTADALGLGAARVHQLNVALEASGGQFGGASALFKGFTQSLGDVEKGSKETIDALYKLGLSKKDIETLSDDQLFQAVVNGLGKMEAGFERNRIAMLLTGRAGDGIDWTKMAQGSSKAIDPEMEARLLAAADAVGAMETAYRNFQIVALEVLAPVIEAIASMNINADDVRKTIQILGAVLAAAFAASVVGQIVRIIALIKELGGVIRAAATAQAFLVGLSGAGLAVVAASAAAAATAYYAIGEAMDSAVKKAKSSGAPPPGGTPPPGTPVRTIGTPKGQASQAAAKAQREADAYDRQISQAVALGAAIEAQTKSLEAKYATELKNIGLTEDQVRLNNELAALAEKQGADVAKINGLDKLSAEDKAKYVAEINAKYAEQKQTLEENLAVINQTNLAEQRRKSLIEEISQAQARLVKRQHDALIVTQELQRAVGNQTQRETQRNIELLRIEGNYQSQKKQLQEDYNNATEQSQKDAIERNLRTLTDGYNDEITVLKNKNLVEDTMRQSMRAGMMNVLEGLADSVTPFQVAVDATSAVFGNLENAISEFARTGKLNFGEFAKSIIADLIAITLRTIILRTVLSAFGGMFGGGGAAAGGTQMTLNTTGSFGTTRFAAAGGSIRANQQYIVGEKGPELFLPNTSGTMIPNNKLGAMGGATSVTYNISAVDASSFKDLVARDPEFIYSVTQVGARRLPR